MLYKKITDACNQERNPAGNFKASVAAQLNLDTFLCFNLEMHLFPLKSIGTVAVSGFST